MKRKLELSDSSGKEQVSNTAQTSTTLSGAIAELGEDLKLFQGYKAYKALQNVSFASLFPTIKMPKPVTPTAKRERTVYAAIYTIYTTNSFDKLLDYISLNRKRKNDNFTKVRYTLSTNYEILFAEEGTHSDKIPAHFSMTGNPRASATCYTAGNIIFDSERRIVDISNKSGDWEPTFDTLFWQIAALVANEYSFADKVIIRKKSPRNFANYQVSSQDLIQFVLKNVSKEQLALMKERNVNLDMHQTRYDYVEQLPSCESHNEKADSSIDDLLTDKVLQAAVKTLRRRPREETTDGGDDYRPDCKRKLF